jgi:hypothetical protein
VRSRGSGGDHEHLCDLEQVSDIEQRDVRALLGVDCVGDQPGEVTWIVDGLLLTDLEVGMLPARPPLLRGESPTPHIPARFGSGRNQEHAQSSCSM